MDRFHRHSIRLQGYDYSQNGYYFVTICTKNRERFLGNIQDGKMQINPTGRIVYDIWLSIPKHHTVVLDACQIMPNHMHGIVVINQGGSRPAPTLGMIVGFLKSESTKQINQSGRGDHAGRPLFGNGIIMSTLSAMRKNIMRLNNRFKIIPKIGIKMNYLMNNFLHLNDDREGEGAALGDFVNIFFDGDFDFFSQGGPIGNPTFSG